MSQQVAVALARGDGIGPEIVDATLLLLDAAGAMQHLRFEPVEMGRRVFDAGDPRGINDEAIRTIERCGLLLKGPMETFKAGGGRSVNVTARTMWSAFANVRHFKTLPGVPTVFSRSGLPVDFYVIRENIEDTYGGIEHRLTADVSSCLRLISAPGSDQVHQFAFETAERLGIQMVHCGHKANIMKLTDGLFLTRFRTVAARFPAIRTRDVHIDALCLELVQRPHEYHLIVLPNLQGDIVSDLAAGLVGGLGFAPSASIGRHISIFEAVHGTAPDIAGRGIANPTALILSAMMLLRHVGLLRLAAVIENALLASLEQGVRTADFGDPAVAPLGTTDFARAVAARLGDMPVAHPAVPVPAQDQPGWHPPPRPVSQPILRTNRSASARSVGCDVIIESADTPDALAQQLQAACDGSPVTLSRIWNRGTQVWPGGSVFTECVNCYRARFEWAGEAAGRDATATVSQLLARLGQRVTVVAHLLLREFDAA